MKRFEPHNRIRGAIEGKIAADWRSALEGMVKAWRDIVTNGPGAGDSTVRFNVQFRSVFEAEKLADLWGVPLPFSSTFNTEQYAAYRRLFPFGMPSDETPEGFGETMGELAKAFSIDLKRK